MADLFRWLVYQGGWKKLPWNNSWFSLGAFGAAFSAIIIVIDFTSPKMLVSGPGQQGRQQQNQEGQQGQPQQKPGFSISSIIPFFAKPGSLMVTSAMTNATVQLDRQPAQPAPASFPQVRPGDHKVVISAPGYDSVTETVSIKEAQPTTIDSGPLNRSTGSLTLVTIPPRASYSLKGTASDNQQEREGRTPANLANLPTDDYTVTLDSSRDGTQKVQFSITAYQTTTQTVDMVKANVASDADPIIAKVLLGQADASTINDSLKQDYAQWLNREIQEYIRVGAFPEAATAISSLKHLGQNTQSQEQHLSEMRDGYEQKVAGQIKDLISDKKLGAARSKLKAVEENVPPETADHLNTQFQNDLGPYAQQIDDAVKSANAAAPADGFTQLQTLAQQHPDDITLALAMAHLLTLQPPDRTRISTQLDALKEFPPENLSSDDSSNLQSMESKLQNEMAIYDRMKAAADAEKVPPIAVDAGRIAALKREIARDQAQIDAASNVNNTVDNITTGLFHTHVRAINVSAKEKEIARDQQAIQDIEAAAQPRQTNTTAQNAFDTFCAQVPW